MLSGLILTQNPDTPEQWLIRSLSEVYQLTVAVDRSIQIPTAEIIQIKISSKLNFIPKKDLRRRYDFCICFNSKAIPMGIFLKASGHVKRLLVYRGTTGGVSALDPASWITFRNPLIDTIIANCQAVNRSLTEAGISPEKVVTIYKGHKAEWYENTGSNDSDSIDSSEFVTVMNYRKSKGLERTIKFVKEHFPHATLSVFGEVPDRVKLFINGKCVNWLGFVDRPYRYFGKFSFFILLSSKEGVPKACVEASFKKIPIIVTDCGGVREIWDDTSAVIIQDLEDENHVKDCVSRIRKLANDPSEKARITQSAFEAVSKKLDFSQTVQQYMKLIETG